MDVTAVEPGRDFRRAIDEHVASCGVLLCVIGRDWLTLKDESGRRRIDDAADFVRLETASALRREIPVVPVLVHGAEMPTADELPEDLRELAYRNAIQLTHAHWDSDVQVLTAALRRQLPSASASSQPLAAPAARPWWKRTPVLATAGFLVAVLAGVMAWKGLPIDDGDAASQAPRKSLVGRWSAPACGEQGLIVTADDGKHLEAVCNTGILHRVAGTYTDAKTIATIVTRTDGAGCVSQAKGRWIIEADDLLTTFQEGWNDPRCKAHSDPATEVLSRLK